MIVAVPVCGFHKRSLVHAGGTAILVKNGIYMSTLEMTWTLPSNFSGQFDQEDMFRVLRHEDSGICMSGSFASTGSQVSVLPPPGSDQPCVHWLTATANPHQSAFKPFVFVPGVRVGTDTASPRPGSRFDRSHPLWSRHEKMMQMLERNSSEGKGMLQKVNSLEEKMVQNVEAVIAGNNPETMRTLFRDAVQEEMAIYEK